MNRTLLITIALLGAIWLASIGVLLFFVAGLTSVPWLLGAAVLQIGVFLTALGLLLVTNTRRPRGINPDQPIDRQVVPIDIALLKDPMAMTAAELERAAIMLPDGNSYGRRMKDDHEVVKRVIQKLHADDGKRPMSSETPEWARELQQAHAAHNGSVERLMSDLQPFSIDMPDEEAHPEHTDQVQHIEKG